MSDLTPAPLKSFVVEVIVGRADLVNERDRMASMTDEEFRARCSELLSLVRKRDDETAKVVGLMLVMANARWEKRVYEEFAEDASKVVSRHLSTLWRWRRKAEEEIGLPPEAPARGTRATRVKDSPIEADSGDAISPNDADDLAAGGERPSTPPPPAAGTSPPQPPPPGEHGARGEPGDGESPPHETLSRPGAKKDRADLTATAVKFEGPAYPTVDYAIGLYRYANSRGRSFCAKVPTVDLVTQRRILDEEIKARDDAHHDRTTGGGYLKRETVEPMTDAEVHA